MSLPPLGLGECASFATEKEWWIQRENNTPAPSTGVFGLGTVWDGHGWATQQQSSCGGSCEACLSEREGLHFFSRHWPGTPTAWRSCATALGLFLQDW